MLMAIVEFVWWGSKVGWGWHSHCNVQPKYCFEVVLCLFCVVIGVVTIKIVLKAFKL